MSCKFNEFVEFSEFLSYVNWRDLLEIFSKANALLVPISLPTQKLFCVLYPFLLASTGGTGTPGTGLALLYSFPLPPQSKSNLYGSSTPPSNGLPSLSKSTNVQPHTITTMNYIKHLNGFFDRIIEDRNLNPTHISLYVALFQFWNSNRFQNPISITRSEVMQISKISSKATYHRCMCDLNDKGYIKYEPSFNPFRGSLVFLFDFSENIKTVPKKSSSSEKKMVEPDPLLNRQRTNGNTSSCTSRGTGIEQALVSSINNTNITNNTNLSKVENLGASTQNIENGDLLGEAKKEEKKLREKKKSFAASSSVSPGVPSREENPGIEEVQSYFREQGFPELEALKFFNYFSSIGWLVGGKSPMVNWQAAAHNWMLNVPKFLSNEKPPDRAKQLQAGTDKDYAEPL